MQFRELSLDDFPGVKALHDRNGLRTADYAEWARLWVDNPFAEEFRDVPAGWVLEDTNGRIVGSACIVPVMYDFGGRAIRASAGRAWVVDPEHRNGSLLFLDAHFSQTNVDLWINTTASPVAGKLWQAFKAERLPQESYDRNLLWITRYQRFARTATRRLAWRGARLLQIPLAGALMVQDVWRRIRWRGGNHRDERPDAVRLDSFDARFDTFWADLCSQAEPRLRAARDAKSLAWHFGSSLQRGETFVLGCPADDEASLDGYLIARRKDNPDIKLRRFQVADLQFRPGRPHVVRRLVAEAIRVARSEKAAAIELTGFEPSKHRLAADIPHRIRRLPTWPFFFKGRDPQLHDRLRHPDAWDPSPFDGDATL